MHIKIATQALRDALARTASIPGAHGAALQTQAVTLSADLAGLTLSRFTSEARISLVVDEEIEVLNDDGRPCVSHATLAAMAGGCNSKITEITSDEKYLHLESGKAKLKLKIFDSETVIEPPEQELETESAPMLLEDLAALLSFAAPAASRDAAASYVFCGVCVRMVGERLYFMATDKKRCHVAITDEHLPVDCVIPSGGVDALLKAIGSSTGGCKFFVGENTAGIIGDRLEMSVTLLVDKYPNAVQQFLEQPDSSIQSKVSVNRDEFIAALKSCACVNEDEGRIVTLEIQPKLMTLKGGNLRDSEIKATLDCRATKAGVFGVAAMQIAAGLEGLKAAEDGTVEILQYQGAFFVRQQDRMAFFALAKPQAT